MARNQGQLTEDQIKRVQQQLRDRSRQLSYDVSQGSAQAEEDIVEIVASIDLEAPNALELEPVPELEEDTAPDNESQSDAVEAAADRVSETRADASTTSVPSSPSIRSDQKRNFALRQEGGPETSVFSGNYPRQAALKAARRLEPASSEEQARTNATEIRLREKGTDKVHIYDAWAWESTAPSDGPDWLSDEITEANVSKKGIEHLDE